MRKKLYICNSIVRDRAVVARRAHNPEVVGSSPAPATKKKVGFLADFFLFSYILKNLYIFAEIKKNGTNSQIGS